MKRLISLLGAVLCLALSTPAFAVQELIKVGNTAPPPIRFLLTTPGSNGQVGLTGQLSNITIMVCRPGTSTFVASTGATAEVGLGYYGYTPGSAEVSATGILQIDVEDTSAYAPASGSAQVVAFDPNDSGFLGLTGISAASIGAAVWNGTGVTIPASHSSSGSSFTLTYRQWLIVSLAVLNGDSSNSAPSPSSTATQNYYEIGQPIGTGTLVAQSTATFDSNKIISGRTIIFQAQDVSL